MTAAHSNVCLAQLAPMIASFRYKLEEPVWREVGQDGNEN